MGLDRYATTRRVSWFVTDNNSKVVFQNLLVHSLRKEKKVVTNTFWNNLFLWISQVEDIHKGSLCIVVFFLVGYTLFSSQSFSGISLG